MALGGGTFVAQNKKLPGAYINFVSLARATAALSGRGVCTMPLELDWGVEDEVITVTNEDFQKDSMRIFGYAADHEKMRGLWDLFLNARVLHAYRLNGGGVKAENDFAVALYGGTRGNDLKIVIQANVDDEALFDVYTYMGTSLVDSQTVSTAAELTANAFVRFKPEAVLAVTASSPLAGGTNKEADGEAHQKYLDKIESYSFNVMGVTAESETVKKLYVSFNKRLRDEMGVKFQLVGHEIAGDYMGVVNVKNNTLDEGWPGTSLVYWVTGAECGCEVNRSVQNKKYDGSFRVNTDFTQAQLEQCIDRGEFVLHRVNSDIRVLEDINSMVTLSEECGAVFKDNQTVRVIDQLGNDDAVLFNTKYLGVVPNKASGRTSLWSDLKKLREDLQTMGAIENFTDSDLTVEQGDTKKSVVVTGAIEVVNAMGRMYMTTVVK